VPAVQACLFHERIDKTLKGRIHPKKWVDHCAFCACLIEIRQMIEIGMIGLAAKNATEEDLAILQASTLADFNFHSAAP
jgi:DNA-binding FadR family transcriptional regulator